MKNYKNKTGVTLVEILIVVAVIAILVSMVIGIAARINSQGKEQLTENTFALLDAALWQFGDYGYRYSDPCDADFKFPLDCNNFSQGDLEGALKDALGVGSVSITASDHNDVDSGSEALYFFLSRVPESRQTLDRIDKSLVTNEDSDGDNMIIRVDDVNYPLMRFIDPWGKTLRYDYYNERESNFKERKKGKKTFPVITSAGPDKSFGTNDDIRNR